MKDMMMKVKVVKMLILSLISLLVLSTSAWAYSLTYTDSSLSADNDVTYTLDFALESGQTYGATFTIANTANTSPEWYAGWFLFKFAGDDGAVVGSLSSPLGSGPWNIVNKGDPTKVLAGGNYNKLQIDGKTGFYVASLAEGGATDDITQGIHLTGPPKSSSFDFTFTVPLSDQEKVNFMSMPFQVGYYDGLAGNSGKFIYGQLSKDLTTKVPEPGTLMLLGPGLIGIGLYRWRRKKG